jgi:N-acetylneuraminic acid mutarotase
MKTRSKIIIIVVVVVVVLLAVYAYESTLGPGPSSWSQAADYPLQVGGTYAVAGQQCFNSTSYIYCIGGQDAAAGPRNNIYSASVSAASHNITAWTSLNPYPQNSDGGSCVVSAGYVYCVGGSYDSGPDDTASAYYAPLEANGTIGSWASTTAYPVPTDTQYCAASSAHIYCVGGYNETDGTSQDSVASSSVWYASLSSSGIGAWSPTTAYPSNVYLPSCFSYADYIYCLGGSDSNDNSLSTAYYAQLTSTGVGSWSSTTAYPIQESGQACAFSSGYIYCVGGQTNDNNPPSYSYAVYYAPVSSSGIGAWKQSGPYPISVGTTCVILSGYMYCVGGFESSQNIQSTYYISLNTLTSTTG